jgi:hypothetical protein
LSSAELGVPSGDKRTVRETTQRTLADFARCVLTVPDIGETTVRDPRRPQITVGVDGHGKIVRFVIPKIDLVGQQGGTVGR